MAWTSFGRVKSETLYGGVKFWRYKGAGGGGGTARCF